MSKVQVRSQIELEVDDLLEGVARLPTRDLESFTKRVLALRARRLANTLPDDESDLLRAINRGLPAEVHARFHELQAKRHDETISEAEYAELLDLIDQIELWDAERMQYLIRLAQHRNQPVDALLEQLGMRQQPDA